MNHKLSNAEKIERDIFRIVIGIMLALGLLLLAPRLMHAASETRLELNVSQAAPRQVEEATANAIRREYAAAWEALASSVQDNNAGVLAPHFVGNALEILTGTVEAQKNNGLRQRIVRHTHNAEVSFYSQEGSSMQLRDTVQLEIEYLDGNKVVHREQKSVRYLAILTVAGDRWRVRHLQSLPE